MRPTFYYAPREAGHPPFVIGGERRPTEQDLADAASGRVMIVRLADMQVFRAEGWEPLSSEIETPDAEKLFQEGDSGVLWPTYPTCPQRYVNEAAARSWAKVRR